MLGSNPNPSPQPLYPKLKIIHMTNKLKERINILKMIKKGMFNELYDLEKYLAIYIASKKSKTQKQKIEKLYN